MTVIGTRINIKRCLSPLEASIMSQIAITAGTVLLGMK